MRKLTFRELVTLSGAAMLFLVLLRGWDSIVAFLGIVLTAIVPLVLGGAIAYVVAIPTTFLERHMLPRSSSTFIKNIRRPVCLAITLVVMVLVIAVSSSMLIPALVDTVGMVQQNGEDFIEEAIKLPLFRLVREPIHNFLQGDFIQSLKRLDISGIVGTLFGGSVGNITTQVFSVVSTVMTTFFGMLFSFILLTDTSNVGRKLAEVVAEYLGPDRTYRLSLVLTVADNSFHNFIVRQCIEALVLGTVATITLFVMSFPYALGVGVLMGLAALVPIVGYPVGLVVGTLIVAIFTGWGALFYAASVAVAQLLESTFLLPHVGNRLTVLPPVWITVAVTIGGGVAGFVGMLVAIPIASTIRQLIVIDIKRRRVRAAYDAHGEGVAQIQEEVTASVQMGEAELAQSLEENDGDGIR